MQWTYVNEESKSDKSFERLAESNFLFSLCVDDCSFNFLVFQQTFTSEVFASEEFKWKVEVSIKSDFSLPLFL